MKKVFTLFLALAIGFGLKAQCPLTTAVDFTATDCHGQQIHLFDILDGGQAVLIDFFFTTCGPCQQATPKIAESYTILGCNMHDVFYMEISDRDSDAACQNWCQNFGIEYPTISGAAGGATICGSSMYNIPAFPTVILIMPDRSIVINDLWPIGSTQTIVNALGQHGIQPNDCNPVVTYDPQVEISIDEVTENSVTATFTSNEDCALYYYVCASEAQIMEWYASGADLVAIAQEHASTETVTMTNTFNDLLPETEYYIIALAIDPDGNYNEPVYETVTTLPQPVVYDETLTFSMDTVNIVDNQYEITRITVYNNTAEDAIISSICDELGWLAFNIDGADFFCNDPIEIFIPQGESFELGFVCNIIAKNTILSDVVTLSSNLPDASFVVMLEEVWSVNENEASATLFPNPANESLTLKGENLGTVRVFNTLGQMVDTFEANGSELNINTTGYENGVYVVKAGEQTLRFVVKH